MTGASVSGEPFTNVAAAQQTGCRSDSRSPVTFWTAAATTFGSWAEPS